MSAEARMRKWLWMMGITQVLLIAVLATLWSSMPAAVPAADSDPAPICFNRVPGSDKPCLTSFTRLATAPDKVAGRRVIITGYLAMRYGIPMLYASQQDYENDIAVNALAIEGDRPALEQLIRQFSYRYVVMDGVFRENEQNLAWLGRLTPPFKASKPITPLRQTHEDVLVPVEYTK